MSAWQSFDRLVARQHGIIAVWQAVALGIPRRTVHRYFQTHGWTSFCGGVWASPHCPGTFVQRCVEKRVRGPGARLLTGGALLTVAGVRPESLPSQIDLLVGPNLAVSDPLVRFHRGPWVLGDKVERRHGIPCAPILRGWTDAASASTVDRLEKDLRAMDRLRLATPEQAAAYLKLRGRFRWCRRAVEAVARVNAELVHSDDEARARRLLRAAGLAPHPRPCKVGTAKQTIGEIDIAFCAIRYGVEVDGPHHEEELVAQRDRYRDARLDRKEWMIDRFTTEFIRACPDDFVGRVLDGSRAAAARGVEPWPCACAH